MYTNILKNLFFAWLFVQDFLFETIFFSKKTTFTLSNDRENLITSLLIFLMKTNYYFSNFVSIEMDELSKITTRQIMERTQTTESTIEWLKQLGM